MELWVIEIDTLFKANLDAINKVYKLKCKEGLYSFTSKHMMEFCVRKDLAATNAENMIKMAYAYSKMTIPDEINAYNFKVSPPISAYHKLDFVEFLEFLARLADFTAPESSATLYDKVDQTLTAVLASIDENVNYDLQETDANASESDDSITS